MDGVFDRISRGHWARLDERAGLQDEKPRYTAVDRTWRRSSDSVGIADAPSGAPTRITAFGTKPASAKVTAASLSSTRFGGAVYR